MIVFNRKVYGELKQYETNFRQAVFGNYVNIPLVKVKEIYQKVKTIGYNKTAQFSCNSCRLKFLQEVGKAYFQYQSDLKETMRKVREGKEEGKEEGKDV